MSCLSLHDDDDSTIRTKNNKNITNKKNHVFSQHLSQNILLCALLSTSASSSLINISFTSDYFLFQIFSMTSIIYTNLFFTSWSLLKLSFSKSYRETSPVFLTYFRSFPFGLKLITDPSINITCNS